MNRSIALLVATSLYAVPIAAEDSPLRQAILDDYQSELGRLFLHFHQNPELSFREEKTAARLADELRQSDVEVTEQVGGTGIVGILRNGEGPLVLVRADMDGLPILENAGLEYQSTARQVDLSGRRFRRHVHGDARYPRVDR